MAVQRQALPFRQRTSSHPRIVDLEGSHIGASNSLRFFYSEGNGVFAGVFAKTWCNLWCFCGRFVVLCMVKMVC